MLQPIVDVYNVAFLQSFNFYDQCILGTLQILISRCIFYETVGLLGFILHTL